MVTLSNPGAVFQKQNTSQAASMTYSTKGNILLIFKIGFSFVVRSIIRIFYINISVIQLRTVQMYGIVILAKYCFEKKKF